MSPSIAARRLGRLLPACIVLATLALHLDMMDLKGISTDEGMRLAIISGDHARQPPPVQIWGTWDEVLQTITPSAYQPAYYLLLNTLMRACERQDLNFFRLVNVGFLALALLGLLVLTRPWATWPRSFFVGLFAANAYLFMHVLQIREYIAAVALYVWGTWLVLQLDRRTLGREWCDVAWFGAYGALLAFGFYLQTWTVFPAIAQGIFLLWRRRPQYWRFLAHLALSYVIVFSLTWPYLQANQQKINVGFWAREQVTLPGQLFNGFHLVLSGHLPGQPALASCLPLAWLSLLGLAVGLFIQFRNLLPQAFAASCTRQAWLMALCIAIPLIFQIGYFYKVEPLSVWPRYFIIHYFFLTFLIGIGFRVLFELRTAAGWRYALPGLLVMVTALLAASAVFQVWSYRRDPYFDTSLSTATDWRNGMDLLAQVLTPDDVVVTSDYIARATLTFTRPLTNQVLTSAELDAGRLRGTRRALMLELAGYNGTREQLTTLLGALGFGPPQAIATGPGQAAPWRVYAFTRN